MPSKRSVATLVLCHTAALLPFLFLGGCRKSTGAGQEAQQGPAREHTATISWNASATPVIGYYVYRSSPPGAAYARITPEPVQTTQYKDSSVQGGRNYSYYVTAVDAKKSESAASKEILVTVPAP